MAQKGKSRFARRFAAAISKSVRLELSKLGWSNKRIVQELQVFFKDDGPIPWDESSISRLLRLDQNNPGKVGTRNRLEVDLALALCELLGISIYTAADLGMRDSPCGDLIDPTYIRSHSKGREHQPMCRVWASRIEQHMAKLNKTARVDIVPMRQTDMSLDPRTVLGQWAAEPLESGVFDGKSRRVLVGLGKHVHAAVSHLVKRPVDTLRVDWLPSMGTYDEWEYFSANDYCGRLVERLGGQTIELTTPGFLPANIHVDEERDVFNDPVHVSLFGSMPSSVEPSTTRIGQAFAADTAIAGSGIAAPGAPLWETPLRTRDRRQLIKADCPAVGDLNGHFLCVTRNGEPILLSEHPLVPDLRNREAWDTNRRALGATPSLYQTIAERHRHMRHPIGAGVIVMAYSSARAPAVYSMLRLGLVNTVVIDAECGKALYEIFESPDKIFDYIPDRVTL
jgi:hypothetical protein